MVDVVNGTFELIGFFLVLMNIKALMRDKKIMGVSALPTLFYSIWGFWNVYYYSELIQIFSCIAGALLALANGFWAYLALVKYRNVN